MLDDFARNIQYHEWKRDGLSHLDKTLNSRLVLHCGKQFASLPELFNLSHSDLIEYLFLNLVPHVDLCFFVGSGLTELLELLRRKLPTKVVAQPIWTMSTLSGPCTNATYGGISEAVRARTKPCRYWPTYRWHSNASRKVFRKGVKRYIYISPFSFCCHLLSNHRGT